MTVPQLKLVDPSDIIQLPLLDFNLTSTAEGRRQLADQLETAFSTLGFVLIVNHGISVDEIEKVRDVARDVCLYPHELQESYLAGAWTSDAENRDILPGAEVGQGYKPRGYWLMQHGTRDAIVHYNFNKIVYLNFGEDPEVHPPPARPHLDRIANYYRHVHTSILRRLCDLTDIVLEIPEGTTYDTLYKVVDKDNENLGHGTGRFMLYHKQPQDVDQKNDGKWLRGHLDLGGFTFITLQPILLLQIRDYFTGKWFYVGHVPGALIVNIGDAMEFLTGGYFKSSIHRVVAPPLDQAGYERLVLIYFSQPRRLAQLDPEQLGLAKLDRLGFKTPDEWVPITCGQWQNEKGRLFGQTEVNDSEGDEPNLVVVYGRLHERWHQVNRKFTVEEAKKTHRVIELKV